MACCRLGWLPQVVRAGGGGEATGLPGGGRRVARSRSARGATGSSWSAAWGGPQVPSRLARLARAQPAAVAAAQLLAMPFTAQLHGRSHRAGSPSPHTPPPATHTLAKPKPGSGKSATTTQLRPWGCPAWRAPHTPCRACRVPAPDPRRQQPGSQIAKRERPLTWSRPFSERLLRDTHTATWTPGGRSLARRTTHPRSRSHLPLPAPRARSGATHTRSACTQPPRHGPRPGGLRLHARSATPARCPARYYHRLQRPLFLHNSRGCSPPPARPHRRRAPPGARMGRMPPRG
jgi:hypothetical protein